MADFTLTLKAQDAVIMREQLLSKLAGASEEFSNSGQGPSNPHEADSVIAQIVWLRALLADLGWGDETAETVTITADRDWLRELAFEGFSDAAECLGEAVRGNLYTATRPRQAVTTEKGKIDAAADMLDALGWPEIEWSDAEHAAYMEASRASAEVV